MRDIGAALPMALAFVVVLTLMASAGMARGIGQQRIANAQLAASTLRHSAALALAAGEAMLHSTGSGSDVTTVEAKRFVQPGGWSDRVGTAFDADDSAVAARYLIMGPERSADGASRFRIVAKARRGDGAVLAVESEWRRARGRWHRTSAVMVP